MQKNPFEMENERLRSQVGALEQLLGVYEQAVIDKSEHVEKALEELRGRTRELERSNAELEQFAYVASHDLQEPLRMIASFAELLAHRYHSKLDSEADQFISFAVDGARRMQQLIEDLLRYSRVGRPGNELTPCDCTATFRAAAANLESAIQESSAVLTHGSLPTVRGHSSELIELFQSLLANAIKFRGPESPTVHVSAERRDDLWQFAVRDNGIGIDPVYHPRIFVIFQRLHSREEYRGTGIGLALCKKIVERHGGRIWVESEVGRGSTFFFNLPVCPA